MAADNPKKYRSSISVEATMGCQTLTLSLA
jgi:hypothetical protein